MKHVNPDSSAIDRHGEFVALFAAHAQRLYSYIYTQLTQTADADDVFQETSRVLWEKFDGFESGTNFFAWACRTAQFQVLAHRQKRQRSRLLFSEEFVRTVAEMAEAENEKLAAQHRALSNCVNKLKQQDRELLLLRYSPGATTKGVAAKVGRSLDAVYKALNRIEQRLLECAQRSLLDEGLT